MLYVAQDEVSVVKAIASFKHPTCSFSDVMTLRIPLPTKGSSSRGDSTGRAAAAAKRVEIVKRNFMLTRVVNGINNFWVDYGRDTDSGSR